MAEVQAVVWLQSTFGNVNYPDGRHQALHVVFIPICWQDDVGATELRRDVLAMHWLDCLSELLLNGSAAAPANREVSGEAAAQSQSHWRIEENAETEKLASARAQQP